jgi:hypothetical protein
MDTIGEEYIISDKIKSKLLSRLKSARKNINNDIYLDKEHEKMCIYYKKYMLIKKKFETTKKVINIPYKYLKSHILSEDHDIEDTFNFIDSNMNIEYFWNDYNKKFINELFVLYNDDGYDKEWINEQNKFIISLSSYDLHTLKTHTRDGDIIANYYIRNNGINIDIDDIGYDRRKSDTIIINKKYAKTNRDFILFYYQIKKYLYNKESKIINLNRIELEKYIIDNYKLFDWNYILKEYIKDIGVIFNKCPKVKNDNIILYRGIETPYHFESFFKNKFPSNIISSYSLDSKVAIGYAAINCCILRLRLIKGSKAILISGISMYDDEKEVLIPFNTTYTIDYPRRIIKIYKTNELCDNDDDVKKMIVTDMSIHLYKSLSRK